MFYRTRSLLFKAAIYGAFFFGGLTFLMNDVQAQTRARELARLDFVIDSVQQAYIAKNNTHALTLGIIEDGRTQAYTFGEIDPTDKRPASAQTVFEIGPYSQTITATLLAAFADSNLVDLDRTILDYLPDTLRNNPALSNITLKNLANHTAGLPRLPDNFASADSLYALDPEFPMDPVEAYTKEDLYDFLLHYRGGMEPGSDYQYSELGYSLIGVILTEISGLSFEELLIEKFGAPLGLENTGSIPYADQDYALSHTLSGQDILPGTYDAWAGTLGIKSSLRDMLVYMRAHFVLAESPVEQAMARTRMFTYYIPPDIDLGLSWLMKPMQEDLVYTYTGDARGSSTYMAFSPDARKAVVILSNAAESVHELGDAVMRALLSVKKER